MLNPNEDFRRQLLSAQEIAPSLQAAYQKEVEAMLSPPLTKRTGLVGGALALILLVTAALIVRADVFYGVRGLMLVAHIALGVACLAAAGFILRDLLQRKHSHKSLSSISGILTVAAGIMTVIALMMGLGHASEPKALFGAFYVFVFYFACVMWSLDNRIKLAELAAREQSLRIECRLADIAERLQK